MKLLFILPEYRREPVGGIRTFYLNLLPALARAGAKVKVLVACRGTFDAPSFVDEDGVEVEYLRSDLFEKHSRNVAASYVSGQRTLGHFLPLGLAAYEQARAGEGFDLVEITDWPLYFLPWVAHGARAPFTISLHSSIGQIRTFEPLPGGEGETHFLRLLETAAFAAAPSVHTNSDLNARYWENITGRKVEVLLPVPAGSRERGAGSKGTQNDECKVQNAKEAKGRERGASRVERGAGRGDAQYSGEPVGRSFGVTEDKVTGDEWRVKEGGTVKGEELRVAGGEQGARRGDAQYSGEPVGRSFGVTGDEVTGDEWRVTCEKRHDAAVASEGLGVKSEEGSNPLPATRDSLRATPRMRGAVFGRLQNWKGAEVLCEALRLAPEVQVEWYGRSVPGANGSGMYADELKEAFADICDRQFFHRGEISHEEVLEAMAGAAFVCVPSLWDVFNLTVVEAMSQGCVVVCSKRAGAEMLIEDGRNGFVFDPENPRSLAAAMRRALQLRGEERSELSREAVETIRIRFDPAENVRQRLEYYAGVAKQAANPTENPFLRDALDFPDAGPPKKRTVWQKVVSRALAVLQRAA